MSVKVKVLEYGTGKIENVRCPECGNMVERGNQALVHVHHRQMLARVGAKGFDMAWQWNRWSGGISDKRVRTKGFRI